jgi:nitrate reductase assembly molybdenum cofactor insertion protein NarJ
MKAKLIYLALLLLFTSNAFSQKQTIVAKFIISDARINKVEATEYYLKARAFFAFYREEGTSVLGFANVMVGDNSQSYGRTFDMHKSTEEETSTSYKSDIYFFKWSYTNTYDHKEGTASVKLIKTYKPAGVAFEITIVPDNLDVLDYKGYMDGSLTDF